MHEKPRNPATTAEIREITLKGLLQQQLGRIYDGEAHLSAEVPRFIERVQSPPLKSLLLDWMAEIREESILLREIAKTLGVGQFEGTSFAVRSVVKHEREQLQKLEKGKECDASILDHAIAELEHQHSEYEAAASYAGELGDIWTAPQLQKILSLKGERQKSFRAFKENGELHHESFPVFNARK
jgi:ferritin-like metal-binding protein YciE